LTAKVIRASLYPAVHGSELEKPLYGRDHQTRKGDVVPTLGKLIAVTPGELDELMGRLDDDELFGAFGVGPRVFAAFGVGPRVSVAGSRSGV
jgi:hypothetical protein